MQKNKDLSKSTIAQTYAQSLQCQKLQKASTQTQSKIHAKGLVGSSFSFVVAENFKQNNLPFLIICNNKEEAAFYLNDLEQLVNKDQVLFYPGSYRRPYQIEETNNANVLLRAEVLNRINSQKKPALLVTYPEALFEKVVTRKELEKNTLQIAVNDTLDSNFINETLFEYQFKRVDFVTEPGEFSLRGGIIDVFSFANDQPYRIEFFGNDIESIRTFDVETQLSIETVKKINIIPNLANKKIEEQRQSFLKYMAQKTIIYTKNAELLFSKIEQLYLKATQTYNQTNATIQQLKPKTLFCNATEIQQQLQKFSVVEFGTNAVLATQTIAFNTAPQPVFNKNFELLITNLAANQQKKYTNYIACTNEQQAKRFHDIFEDIEQNVAYTTLILPLYQGFIDHNLKIACYTDHQIMERYHKFHLKNGYSKKQALTLKELTNLSIGDYVTHIDHGIGKFGGLQKIEVEGKKQEAIKLIYGERDVLYLSIHSLHKITKFNGKDGKPPKIYKLGSKAWKNLKQKTKSRVKEIAFNLIKVYAKRKAEKGFQYYPDSYLQHELEASFIYEDTPDQSTTTAAIKKDMESEQPMDRLVCGDVGFGKTEVAIRAAFKAVDNGKQVAVLVPTTILAYQHFRTFTERLKDFPVTVDYTNRFRTTKEKRATLENLEKGVVDIIIGTHQLAHANVKFKDLGLLIVDEEQKFGVAVKEKLKTLKNHVDVLTLTATPIPRTLQFSLMAARDLSVITTPPPNRYPIESRVIRFNETTIRDAISYEIQRGGQVFFIHNRIENIKEVAGMLQRLIPDAKIGIGHGQMEGKKLEQLMLSFINGEFDILVSTTIVESGLDVPNANTIFINNANNFGLSDLHQMRGRVGRSNKKAFCYFITPEYSAITEDARKRITALQQFTELGSGFNIAMKDLEIRGAGDLLGGEQSGFINEIGFDTYQKILNEAIEELKENEFKDLYTTPTTKEYVKEITLESDFEILFPDYYINNVTERLNLYTKLNNVKTEEALQQFIAELNDRFGELPEEANRLIQSVRIKWKAKALGIEKVVLKKNTMVGYFIKNPESDFYNSTTFSTILNYLQKNPNACKMQQKQTKKGMRLLITFTNINCLNKALDALSSLL